jgi:nicotinamide-nucleotide adenylyltransferase
MTIGLFIGRFQPFHLGHLSDIKQALKDVDELIIVIGSSQYSGTEKNPFSCEERKRMINKVLKKEGLSNYKIIPVRDIHNNPRWVAHVEKHIPKVDVVYTGNKLVERLFKERGYSVRRVRMIKGLDSTKIRRMIAANKPWKNLVPESVANEIERIKSLHKF